MSLIEFKREQASSYNFRKFGYNSDIDTSTDPEDIWDYGGIYTFPSDSGETIYISSSSSSDTSSFVVQGLDSNFYEKTETVTLNGQTSVEVGSFSRVYRAFNDSSNDLNGDVYMYTTGTVSAGVPQTATTVKAQVLTGFQQTQMAIYTVPADYTAYVADISCSAPRLANQTIAIQMHLDVREYDKVFRTRLVFGVNDSLYQDQLFAPIVLPPKTDIRLRAQQVYASDTPVAASFDLYLKRNY
jgi:hypothetical protein